MAIHIKNDVAKLNEYAFLSFLSFSVLKLVAANCNIFFFFGSTQSTLNIGSPVSFFSGKQAPNKVLLISCLTADTKGF